MAKQLLYGDEARQKMLVGIKKLAQAVTTTLGPKGRNVAIDGPYGPPAILHDGVSVAKQIDLEDKFEDMGAKLVKEAASKTNEVAGDGTTTGTLLAWKISELGMKYVTSGANPMIMKRGIDKAVKAVIKKIEKVAKPVAESDWKKVATISAQSEVIGDKIAEALKLVGKNGLIEVEEGSGMDITIQHKEGMSIDKGFPTPHFITNADTMEAEMNNPYILITDHQIQTIKPIVPLLESLMGNGKELVIIADDVVGTALRDIAVNKVAGAKILIVKAPEFGDRRKAMLQDIAVLTGAEFISKDVDFKLKDISVEDLGRADSVRSSKDNTVIVGGRGDKEQVKARVLEDKTLAFLKEKAHITIVEKENTA